MARRRPLVVAALGGNALLRRGEDLGYEAQRDNVARAAHALGQLARDVDLVVTHGNGPQVGMLAVQEVDPTWPLDVLVAETQGMIGYAIATELDNVLCRPATTVVLTRVEVDPADPAFVVPTKPIGPTYATEAAGHEAAAGQEWSFITVTDGWRRVVPSPRPHRVLELDTIKELVASGSIPVCCGGGGIPVVRSPSGHHGVEAVIDKDATSALLASALDADGLLLLTDVDGVYDGWGTTTPHRLDHVDIDDIELGRYAAGSMRPKVTACADFVLAHGAVARIGRLEDAHGMWHGSAGTRVG